MGAIVCRICPLVEAGTEAALVVWVALAVWVESAALVVWVELAALVVSVELAALVVWAESATLVVWVESAALVVWVAAAPIAPRPYRLAGTAAVGSTIPNIAAAHPIGTARRQTDSAALRGVIPSRTARPALVNSSGARVAIWRATAQRAEVLATGQAEAAWATGAEALATARLVAEPTV
jgi:hypothetical protein